MFPLKVLMLTVPVSSVLAAFVTPNDISPIKNCCDLGFRQLIFSQTVNKPKVYQFKRFCNNRRSSPTSGYCDTLTDGGGWLVVKRRNDGTENFHRNWADYEVGFRSLTGEFWYGLHALHCMTSHGQWQLHIDYTLTDGTKGYLSYLSFRVGSAYSNYRLSISGFNGVTAKDPFVTGSLLNGMPFNTKDRDNDNWSRNCAEDHVGQAGGWWYNDCSHIFLNNQYKNYYGIAVNKIWKQVTFVEKKIRPINCKL